MRELAIKDIVDKTNERTGNESKQTHRNERTGMVVSREQQRYVSAEK